MQEKIKEITAKCIEANEDILKLGFGCKLKHPSGIIVTIWRVYPPSPNGELFACTDLDRDTKICQFEILGRDIRLADILLAIKKSGKYENGQCATRWQERGFDIVCGHPFPCPEHHVDVSDLLTAYNLLKDNLSDQSEECINFIHGILIKK